MDINSEIFQNLNGATEEVSVISVDEEQVNIYNNLTKTVPAIIHGNGAAKTVLNRFGNYIGKAYSASTGCIVCRENTFKLDSEKVRAHFFSNLIINLTKNIFIYLFMLSERRMARSDAWYLYRTSDAIFERIL